MNRKKVTIKISHLRTIKAHYFYNSLSVSILVNHIMRHGKKSIADKIVCTALELVREKLSTNPLDVLEKAIANAQPKIKVKRVRMGGATNSVPVNISTKESLSLAMRYIVQAIKERSEKTSALRLATELIESAQKRGRASKKAQDLEKLAESNRVYGGYSPEPIASTIASTMAA